MWTLSQAVQNSFSVVGCNFMKLQTLQYQLDFQNLCTATGADEKWTGIDLNQKMQIFEYRISAAVMNRNVFAILLIQIQITCNLRPTNIFLIDIVKEAKEEPVRSILEGEIPEKEKNAFERFPCVLLSTISFRYPICVGTGDQMFLSCCTLFYVRTNCAQASRHDCRWPLEMQYAENACNVLQKEENMNEIWGPIQPIFNVTYTTRNFENKKI